MEEESRHVNFIKKEWKSLVNLLCLIGIIIWLVVVSSRMTSLRQQNEKIISTFDSIESVTISNNSDLNEMSKQIDKIENNVTYIVRKLRRR